MNNKNRFSAFIIGLFAFVFATSCAPTSHNDGQDYYDPEHRPFGRYDEPVVINGVMEFLNHNDSRVPSSITPETNVFIKKLKEEMNIEWRYMWKVPSSQYENKLTATILSKNYPDILRLNASQYNNFLKQGLLKDLTETYKYASPKVKEYLNRDPEVIERLKQDDGKIYTIPQYDDIKREVPVMYYRKDWLEKEKLSVPKTPAELKNVLKVFKEKYNATAGLAMSKSISGSHFSINRYLQMFGSNPFSFVKNGNDELIASEVTNESKNALTYLADLFKSGLLDPNFGSNDATMVESNVKQQKTGVIFGPWWQYEFPLADLLPSQDWGAAEIPLEEGAKLVLPKQQITYYYVVLKQCKNPEALMKMINAYIEWDGAEGCKAEDGYVWSWCPTQFYDPYDINMQHVEMNKKLEHLVQFREAIILTDSDERANLFKKASESTSLMKERLTVFQLKEVDPSFKQIESLFSDNDKKRYIEMIQNKSGSLSSLFKNNILNRELDKETMNNFNRLLNYLSDMVLTDNSNNYENQGNK